MAFANPLNKEVQRKIKHHRNAIQSYVDEHNKPVNCTGSLDGMHHLPKDPFIVPLMSLDAHLDGILKSEYSSPEEFFDPLRALCLGHIFLPDGEQHLAQIKRELENVMLQNVDQADIIPLIQPAIHQLTEMADAAAVDSVESISPQEPQYLQEENQELRKKLNKNGQDIALLRENFMTILLDGFEKKIREQTEPAVDTAPTNPVSDAVEYPIILDGKKAELSPEARK